MTIDTYQDKEKGLTAEDFAARRGVTLSEAPGVLTTVRDKHGNTVPIIGKSFVGSEGEAVRFNSPIQRGNGSVDERGWTALGIGTVIRRETGEEVPAYVFANEQGLVKKVDAAAHEAFLDKRNADQEQRRFNERMAAQRKAPQQPSAPIEAHKPSLDDCIPLSELRAQVAASFEAPAPAAPGKNEARTAIGSRPEDFPPEDRAALEAFAQYANFKRKAQLRGDGDGSERFGRLMGMELNKLSPAARKSAEAVASSMYGDANVAF